MRGTSLAILVLCGCARGGSATGADAAGATRADAAADKGDALVEPPDAAPDAPPPPPDACIPVTTQLLVNAALDDEPMGMGWSEQRIKPTYPLITSQDSRLAPTEHSAPYKAWLGGFTGSGVTDALTQDVAIPPATTALVLAGYYAVRTDEQSAIVHDTAQVSLTQTSDAPIATALELSNATPQTDWLPFQYAFAQDLSGQTVRMHFASTNDAVYPTSFFFDTLALTATHGCP